MENNNKNRFIRIAVLAAALVAVLCSGLLTRLLPSFSAAFNGILPRPFVLIRLALMVLVVLIAKDLAVLLLGAVHPKKHRTRTILSLLTSSVRYLAALLMIFLGLSILGADVSTIVASIGILGLVVGFGAESLISDVITGIFMMFENQYNVGDYIEVGGYRGKVSSIGIRTTCLEDAGGNVKIINNSDMRGILNRSDNPSRAVCTIAIPYETDLEKLEAKIPAMLDGIFAKHTDTLLEAPVYLGVDELADSAIVLKFVAAVADKNIYSAARILNHDILLAFRRAGVECPFPQLDVHTK